MADDGGDGQPGGAGWRLCSSGSQELSQESTCEDFLKAEGADQVRYVRSRLEANGALEIKGVDNPMGSISHYCGTNPDRKIGTLENFFDKE